MKSRVAEKILDDADRRAREIGEEARRQVETLIREHDQERARLSQALEEELARGVQAEVDRRIALADVAMQNERLRVRRDILDRVIDRCRNALTEDRDLYRRFLAAMVVRGARTGREEVLMGADDIKALGPDLLGDLNRALEEKTNLPGRLTLSASSDDPGGGLLLKDGAVTFNASLDQALRTLIDRHFETFLQRLFPAEDLIAHGNNKV